MVCQERGRPNVAGRPQHWRGGALAHPAARWGTKLQATEPKATGNGDSHGMFSERCAAQVHACPFPLLLLLVLLHHLLLLAPLLKLKDLLLLLLPHGGWAT